jgi:glycosyltransferase involved in cell wall biosynthesis
MDPLVSVIIPTYRHTGSLHRAIESVNLQTYNNIEVLLVETPAKSSRNSSNIKDTIDYPAEHIITDYSIGVAKARNIGISRSSGKYIAFLDDDDEWHREKIRIQVDRLESKPAKVGASITGNIKIDPDGSERTTYIPHLPDDPVEYQICANIGSFSMLMVRSKVVRVIGCLDERLDQREDSDFLLRIALHFEFDIVKRPLVRKHVHGDHHLGSDYSTAIKSQQIFRTKYRSLADELGVRNVMEASAEFGMGRTALASSHYLQAIRHFVSAIRYNPRDTWLYIHLLIALGGPVSYRMAKFISKHIRQ